MVSPESESVESVMKFLSTFGVTGKLSNMKDTIFVDLPVGVAKDMLQTEFGTFRSIDKSDIVLTRVTKPYSLPEEVAKHVALVDDIVRFPSVVRTLLSTLDSDPEFKSDATSSAASFSCGTTCSGYTNPSVLAQAYNFSYPQVATAGNSIAVAEFQNQYYDTTDLNAFSSKCSTPSITVTTTIGGNNPNTCATGLQPCVESLLDIEYLGAITSPIPMTDIYLSTYSLQSWMDTIFGLSPAPLVHSVSYGNDEVQQTSTAYMQTVDAQFQQAAALGLSILFASGDQGVWGRTGSCKGTTCTFHPDFPAGSPYVTSVGGTNFQTKSVIGTESTWNCGGGGFSETFAQPSWQASAVSGYFTAATKAGVLPSASLYNAKGRGYPDLAALGGQTNSYCVSYKDGTFGGVAGTSAACPVVAGIFGIINNARLKAGKSSMGFLNQFIYANGQCFQDVSDLTKNNCYSGYDGFGATSGWDPATGMGTPNTGCLVAAALALP